VPTPPFDLVPVDVDVAEPDHSISRFRCSTESKTPAFAAADCERAENQAEQDESHAVAALKPVLKLAAKKQES